MSGELVIVIDSREQRPYEWMDVTTVRVGLPAGDYSVQGLEDRIAIERKTLTDAYGTFGRGRKRFERELEKLSLMDFAAVVMETTMEKALFHPPSRSRFSPKSFNRSVMAWQQRFGVHFIYAGCRLLAERQTYLMLERFYKEAEQ